MEKFERISGVVLKMASPLIGRLGGFIAGALVTEGVAVEHADLFVNTLGALVVMALDICFVIAKRRASQKKERNGIL